MEKKVAEFIASLQSDKRLASLDEASTKQAVVIKMLSLLGWDIFNVDEVRPDLTVKSTVIDFALRVNRIDTVFVGVGRAGEELSQDQREVLGCAIAEGVKLVLVTNGLQWWFYLAFREGNPEQRKFCAVELQKQPAEEAASRLVSFLARSSVAGGKALKKAETTLDSRQSRAVERHLKEAWQKLLSRPPEALVKLINDHFERLSGYRAEERLITKYLSAWSRGDACEEIIDLKEPVAAAGRSYEGQRIRSFAFKGQNREVESWNQLLVKLCGLLAAAHHQDLEKLLWHAVDNKFFFRDNPEELRLPMNIEGTNIFVETALNADDTVKVALSILKAFGYSGSELTIATAEN